MGTIYYDFKLSDTQIKKLIDNNSVSFDSKSVIARNVKSADGAVTIDISELGTVAAIMIETTGDIIVTINSEDVAISSFLFITLAGLTSLAIECSDADGYDVNVVVWGT